MSGMFLPGRGLGVESIQPGSPAEQVGLVPGNVIVAVNGLRLESPEILDQAVAQSGGILTLEVAVADDAPTQMVQLTLQRVAVASY
jgi:S1-C subfamily serine protease